MTSFQEEDDGFHDCVEPPVEVPTEPPVELPAESSTEPPAEPPASVATFDDDDVEEIPRTAPSDKSIEKALDAKEKGNDAFKARDFDLAIQYYSLALSLCPEEEKDNMATFYGNRSASYYAEDEFELVVQDCSAALELKPEYLKVLARRMQAQDKLEKYEEAIAGKNNGSELFS